MSVAAAKENMVSNGADNIAVVRLSSEELTEALDKARRQYITRSLERRVLKGTPVSTLDS